jgi:hypothetical protein
MQGVRFDLKANEICELVRVALDTHRDPVSRIIKIALKLIKDRNPKLKAVVSYADPAEGHHGGIYQALGWAYLGTTPQKNDYIIHGKFRHNRTVNGQVQLRGCRDSKTRLDVIRDKIDPKASYISTGGKFKYVYFFDRSTKIESLPYPKRRKHSADATPIQGERAVELRPRRSKNPNLSA